MKLDQFLAAKSIDDFTVADFTETKDRWEKGAARGDSKAFFAKNEKWRKALGGKPLRVRYQSSEIKFGFATLNGVLRQYIAIGGIAIGWGVPKDPEFVVYDSTTFEEKFRGTWTRVLKYLDNCPAASMKTKQVAAPVKQPVASEPVQAKTVRKRVMSPTNQKKLDDLTRYDKKLNPLFASLTKHYESTLDREFKMGEVDAKYLAPIEKDLSTARGIASAWLEKAVTPTQKADVRKLLKVIDQNMADGKKGADPLPDGTYIVSLMKTISAEFLNRN